MTSPTTAAGNLAATLVIAALVRSKCDVLMPFGEGHRYDIAVDFGGTLLRIQCKLGHLRKGSVYFQTISYARGTNSTRNYVGEVDFFGVWCVENDETYLVPTEHVASGYGVLRVDGPKNNQKRGIRMADRYRTADVVAAGFTVEHPSVLWTVSDTNHIHGLSEITHGQYASYRRGCRCQDCTESNSRRSKAYRDGRRNRDLTEVGA